MKYIVAEHYDHQSHFLKAWERRGLLYIVLVLFRWQRMGQ
jgi:hypothetical protein